MEATKVEDTAKVEKVAEAMNNKAADPNIKLEALKSMRSEIQAQRKQLEVELVLIDDLIAIHQSPDDSNAASKRRDWWHSSPGIMQKAIRLVLDLYDKHPRFIKTGEVITALKAAGLTLGGASPSANVSSYLNHSEDLANIRGYGWVRKRDLARWQQQIICIQ